MSVEYDTLPDAPNYPPPSVPSESLISVPRLSMPPVSIKQKHFKDIDTSKKELSKVSDVNLYPRTTAVAKAFIDKNYKMAKQMGPDVLEGTGYANPRPENLLIQPMHEVMSNKDPLLISAIGNYSAIGLLRAYEDKQYVLEPNNLKKLGILEKLGMKVDYFDRQAFQDIENGNEAFFNGLAKVTAEIVENIRGGRKTRRRKHSKKSRKTHRRKKSKSLRK